jgi:hypothetical protein
MSKSNLIQLTPSQLRGILRRERRVGSRQRQRAPQPGQPLPVPQGGIRLANPLGVDAWQDDDIVEALAYEPQPLDGREVLDVLATTSPGCLTQTGYPFSACQAASVKAKDPSKMSATFAVVTRGKAPNRHGNMVQIAEGPNGRGMTIDDWAANPVVLFDHGMGLSMPIGTAMRDGELYWRASKNQAISTVFFSQSLPEAAAIYALIDEGILRAASVQFIPTKAMRLALKNDKLPDGVQSLDYAGYDFVESQLLEWSVVAIPADPGALKKSLDVGKVAGQRIGPGLKVALAQHLAPSPVQGIGVTFEMPAPAVSQSVETGSSVDEVAQTRTLSGTSAAVEPIDYHALAGEVRQSLSTPEPKLNAAAVVMEVQSALAGLADVVQGQQALSQRLAQIRGI